MPDRIRCEGSLVEVPKGTEIHTDAKEPRAVCPVCKGRVGLTPASEKFPTVRYGTHYVRTRKAQGDAQAAPAAPAEPKAKKDSSAKNGAVTVVLTPTGHRMILEELVSLGSPEAAAAKSATTKVSHGYKRVTVELSSETALVLAELVAGKSFSSSTSQKAQKEVVAELSKALA